MKLQAQMKSLVVGITATLATIAMLSASAQAAILTGTVTLDQLLAGNSYQLGDKLFDNFRTFSTVNIGGAKGPESSQISVFGEIVDNAYNLLFQSPLWNVKLDQAIDTTFQYDVTVLDPSKWINKVDLELSSYGVSGGGFITIVDRVDLLNPGSGSLNLFATSVSPFDSVIKDVLPPQKKISVTKDIALVANGGFASISLINQSVHQTPDPIPESSTLLGLFALGGLGLTVTIKRLKTTVISVG